MRGSRGFVLAIALVLAGTVRAEDAQLLKPGHVWCHDEATFATLVDVPAGKAREGRLLQFIFKGECTRLQAMTEVIDVRTKRTPKGNPYICYRVRDFLGLVTAETVCTFESDLTTLRRVVAERKGDFRMLLSTDDLKLAECKEGGKVTLRRADDKRWLRDPGAIFPVSLVYEGVPVDGADLPRAAREGCKGVDYLTLKWIYPK